MPLVETPSNTKEPDRLVLVAGNRRVLWVVAGLFAFIAVATALGIRHLTLPAALGNGIGAIIIGGLAVLAAHRAKQNEPRMILHDQNRLLTVNTPGFGTFDISSLGTARADRTGYARSTEIWLTLEAAPDGSRAELRLPVRILMSHKQAQGVAQQINARRGLRGA